MQFWLLFFFGFCFLDAQFYLSSIRFILKEKKKILLKNKTMQMVEKENTVSLLPFSLQKRKEKKKGSKCSIYLLSGLF